MSLKQVRTAALAATLIAGTTAFAYAQSGSSSTGAGNSPTKHSESSQMQNGKHGPAASSTTGAGGNAMDAGGSASKNEEKSGEMKKGESTKEKSSAMKEESGKSSSDKSTSGKSTTGKGGEADKAGTSGNEAGKSSMPGASKSSAETDKNGAKAGSANNTTGKSEQSDTTGKGSNASPASSSASNANAPVNLTTEQKTTIRKTIIDNKSAPRVTNVNFNISVGTVVPTTVHFAPLPATIVEIHPAWRGYEYFVYNDEVIIIEPHSRKIVQVIVVS